MLMSVELASRYTSYVAVDPKEQTSLKESLMMMKSRDVHNDVPNTATYLTPWLTDGAVMVFNLERSRGWHVVSSVVTLNFMVTLSVG